MEFFLTLKKKPQETQETEGSLAKDLANQLDNLAFTDWNLMCQDVEIPCHKFILGSRSPVFQRMFKQTGLEESKTNQTEIKVSFALSNWLSKDDLRIFS